MDYNFVRSDPVFTSEYYLDPVNLETRIHNFGLYLGSND